MGKAYSEADRAVFALTEQLVAPTASALKLSVIGFLEFVQHCLAAGAMGGVDISGLAPAKL